MEEWWLEKSWDADVLIPPEIRKCVVFVGYEMADSSKRLAGTAFLMWRPFRTMPEQSHVYLITARHVIDGIKRNGIEKIQLRFNEKDGVARWVHTSLSSWFFHPDGKGVDLAAVRIRQTLDGMDHLAFPEQSIAGPDDFEAFEIGPGQDVFISGWFSHHGGNTSRNVPIIRVGNIAAMPEEKVQSGMGPIDAFLIEARSTRGLSGSPVFVHVTRSFPGGRGSRNTPNPIQPVNLLLGVAQGHWEVAASLSAQDAIYDPDSQEPVNVGIGIVVPAQKIVEMLDQPECRAMEDKIEEETQRANLPVMDSAVDDDVHFTQADFEAALRRASRKIEPEK